jgi:hypothetical protein
MRAHVAHDEVGVAVVSDLKDASLRMEAKLKSLNLDNLQIRLSRRVWPGSFSSHRIAEGAHVKFDGISVALFELPGELLLVGLQADAYDTDPYAEARHSRATGHGFALVESGVYLARHVIELRLGPTSLFEQQAAGVLEQRAKCVLVLFEVPNEARDDADSLFVLKAQTGPAPRVRFPVAANGLEVVA